MKVLLGLIGGIMIVGFLISQSQAAHLRCHTGNTLGLVAIRSDPPHIVGTLPSKFTSQPGYFDVRYNCTGKGVQARRVDLGTYDVLFPGLQARVAVTSAISQEGVSASVFPLGGGLVRISLRGPIVGNDVASRRDVPFSVVVY